MGLISNVINTLIDKENNSKRTLNTSLESLNISAEVIKNDDDNDDRIEPKPMEQPVIPVPSTVLSINPYCTVTKTANNIYRILLSNMINTSDFYNTAFEILENSTENDIIYIDIISPGGYVNTGMNFLELMETTPSLKVTNIVSYGYSMGAMIWGYGDILQLNDGIVMFHNILIGAYDNLNRLKSKINAQLNLAKQMYQPIVDKGILTESDINKIFDKNIDLYLDKTTLQSRIDNWNKNNQERLQQLLNLNQGVNNE